MKKQLIYWLAAAILLTTGCQKELSFEGSNTPATGSLQSDVTGDCLPKTVNGTYVAAIQLIPATNTITVQVNITKTGTYVVTTDTVNGYYFRATGAFTTLGANTVTLRGNGTPFQAHVDNFVVSFDSTICDIQVTVTSPGLGTLGGAPNACAPITVNGGYSPGVALSAANNAVVQVNVASTGIFNITTDTLAGIWFSFSGVLSSTGPQNVTLQAQGSIPASTTPGAKTFTVKLGTGSCTFVVNVASPAAGTVNCGTAVISGTYAAGAVLVAADTVQISVTVTTIGAYNITTDTVNGMWFNASGNFATATTIPLTLTGHGTPTASGSFLFTVKFGTSTCTFTVTVLNGDHFPLTANSWWSYDDVDGVFVTPGDSLARFNINSIVLAANTYRLFQNKDNTTITDSSYFRKNVNDYFERTQTDFYTAVFTFDVPAQGDINFLKEGLNTNDTWASTTFSGMVSGIPAYLKYVFTCLNANGTATINGNNFTNVYKIAWKPQISAAAGGPYQDEFVSFESWYAKGVGLIYFKVIDLTGGPSSDVNLMHWQVF